MPQQRALILLRPLQARRSFRTAPPSRDSIKKALIIDRSSFLEQNLGRVIGLIKRLKLFGFPVYIRRNSEVSDFLEVNDNLDQVVEALWDVKKFNYSVDYDKILAEQNLMQDRIKVIDMFLLENIEVALNKGFVKGGSTISNGWECCVADVGFEDVIEEIDAATKEGGRELNEGLILQFFGTADEEEILKFYIFINGVKRGSVEQKDRVERIEHSLLLSRPKVVVKKIISSSSLDRKLGLLDVK